jgi:hypothetical protein
MGGLGIGIVPKNLVVGEFKSIKEIKTSKDYFINQIIIARQLGKGSTVKEKEFINFCKDEIQKLGK